jgi:hypothetical protein
LELFSFACVELIKDSTWMSLCSGTWLWEFFKNKYPLPRILFDLNKHIIECGSMSVENSIMHIEEVSKNRTSFESRETSDTH